MHVVVQIVVSLRAKLDLLEVDFDADLADVNILEREVLLEAVCALVCDIAERIQQLLCPALIERNVGLQCLVQIGQQLLQRFALLDLKEVLIVVWVAHVVEAKVAGAVLGEEQLFCGANLVEELGEELVVLKALRDQVALDGQAFVTIVGKLLDNTARVALKHPDRLLTIVNGSDAAGVELALKRSFLLLDQLVRQLDRLVISAINAIPNKAVYILRCALGVTIDLPHCLLAFDALLVACVNEGSQLM